MFESLSTACRTSSSRFAARPASPRRRRGRAARDPAGAARGRRQLQGRQGVHRPRPRQGVDQEVLEPDAGAAGRADRPRRDAGALRRRAGRAAAGAASPRVILLLGLQGSGKTTTSASWDVAGPQGRHPLLVSTDVRRPAAIQQLRSSAKQAGVRVHDPAGRDRPGARASGALAEARNARLRRRHRRHRRPAAHRRRADGRAAGDQGGRASRPTCCTSPTR
jgi:hypothetical protein